ncbi:MAG: hypothetical protein JO319_16535 [Acidobacteriaceae bacterium]|nr:hypothetical protein [Acidobacteriaceae bacterium]
MLNQVTHWVEIAAAVIDALLLMRVLQLRLQRIYLFITIVCVLAVFFDGVTLWLGIQSAESGRVSLYSRFLYVVIYPAAAWEVFEEIRARIAPLRRAAMLRLITSLIMAAIFGLVFIAFADTAQAGSQGVITLLAVVLWTGSSVASVAFLWTMHRAIKKQKIALPNNTFVWLVYFELLLALEVVICIYAIAGPLLNQGAEDIADIVFNTYGMLITLWCVWKLRAIASGVPSAQEKPSL